MIKKTIGRKVSRPSTAVCLVLMVSVFAWGLGYKLDQYAAPHAAEHELPKFKVLSKNEQTWAAEAAQSPRSLTPSGRLRSVQTGFFFALPPADLDMPEPAPVRAMAGIERLARPTLPALSHFYIRPPPQA